MNKTSQLTAEVFIDVLEHMAFMFAEIPESDQKIDFTSEVNLLAEIKFDGPITGTIQTAAAVEFCRELARGMLGMESEDELPGSAAEDALKEMLNVVCGELLDKLAGNKPLFNLGIPVVSQIKKSETRKLAERPEAVILLVDDTPLLALTTIN